MVAGAPARVCAWVIHHEAHEGTKKGQVKGVCTTEDTEGTEKVDSDPREGQSIVGLEG